MFKGVKKREEGIKWFFVDDKVFYEEKDVGEGIKKYVKYWRKV